MLNQYRPNLQFPTRSVKSGQGRDRRYSVNVCVLTCAVYPFNVLLLYVSQVQHRDVLVTYKLLKYSSPIDRHNISSPSITHSYKEIDPDLLVILNRHTTRFNLGPLKHRSCCHMLWLSMASAALHDFLIFFLCLRLWTVALRRPSTTDTAAMYYYACYHSCTTHCMLVSYSPSICLCFL